MKFKIQDGTRFQRLLAVSVQLPRRKRYASVVADTLAFLVILALAFTAWVLLP